MEAGRTPYDPTKSPGTQMAGATFNITYGSGFAGGDVYMDSVTLFQGLTVSQAIGCAKSVDPSDNNDKKMDGLIGLAFSSGAKITNGFPQNPGSTNTPMNSGMFCFKSKE